MCKRLPPIKKRKKERETPQIKKQTEVSRGCVRETPLIKKKMNPAWDV